MDAATTRLQVGIRELKNDLSRYVRRARAGDEVVITDRGRPVARLTAVDATTDHLADLVAAGVVRAPEAAPRPRGPRVVPDGPVSDLVAEQRR